MKKALAFLMAAVMLMSMLTACGNKDVADDTKDNNVSTTEANQATADTKDNSDAPTADADQAAADEVAALIDAIYVQARTEETDAQCEAAKAAWDALTDAQKALVSKLDILTDAEAKLAQLKKEAADKATDGSGKVADVFPVAQQTSIDTLKNYGLPIAK